jgi:hypothetical protein
MATETVTGAHEPVAPLHVSPRGMGVGDSSWRNLQKLGGATALIAILLAPAEIAISSVPSVERATAQTVTVIDWFNLLQKHWFVALRNLGLLNIVGAALLIPTILAVYSLLWREHEAYATLGAALFFLGTAIYLANSKAFPMLWLSRQYMVAGEAQRALLAAAGQTMLAEGQSRAGILVIEFACLVLSVVMLKSEVFSKATGCAGVLANTLMMVVEIAFMPPIGVGMIIAAAGGLSLMTWYFLMGCRLLKLGATVREQAHGRTPD